MRQIQIKRQAAVSLTKLKTERLFGQLPELVKSLPRMTEAQLLQMLIRAEQLADFAFLIRGACASELRSRAPKLLGGRGKKDATGAGLQAQMDALAKKIGTGRKTLETDARIKETFFPVIDETTLEHMPPLAREYYVIALSAPDPLAAIKTAIDRCSDPQFSLRQFRSKVRFLKAGGALSDAPMSARSVLVLDAIVSAEISRLISDLIMKTGKSKDEIVADAIRAFHSARSKSSERSSNISKSPQSGMHTHDDTQLKLKM